jgi:hypothetical protein
MMKSLFLTVVIGSRSVGALSNDEAYLAPYVDELVHWRDSEVPAMSRVVALTKVAGFVPTSLINTFIPLFLPAGKTMDLEMALTLHNLPAVGDMDILAHNVTLGHLGDLQKAEISLVSDSEFTWAASVKLQDLSISASAWLTLYGIPFNSTIAMSFTNMSIDIKGIVAFNRTRICDVWGDVLTSSLSCALWPIMGGDGVTGLKMTSLELNLDDFQLDMNLTNPEMDPDTAEGLRQSMLQVVDELKPGLLANLSTQYSQMALDMGNNALLTTIPKLHKDSPCALDSLVPVMNVSRVCIANNGGYTMGFGYHDCPAHTVSPKTSRYPIDQSRCVDVESVMPGVAEGEVVRVATDAAAGLEEIVSPAFHYAENSNVAGFQCGGGTLTYNCELISLVPIDPSSLPPVSKVCITNHAGFVMDFETKNLRTQAWVAKSDSYPINQMKCIDLSSTAEVSEGDEFKIKVHAHAGKKNPTDRDVKYQANGLTAAFDCTGTTLNYHCKLLVGGMAVASSYLV